MTKIGFVSLGCPKNLVDTEVMMGLVRADGYELTTDEREAEIIVINTCAFIDPAKEESIETILEMAELKKTGRCRKLIVAGCLAERYREALLQEMPEIDAVLGTNQIEDILRAIAGCDGRAISSQRASDYLYDHTTPRVLATPGYTAYIKIAEGCDHTCDFCIIPRLRGPMRSRPIDSVVREADALAAQGVREIILVGQDTTHYGQDLGLANGLAQLLRRLARIDGLRWIRFLYGYPHHVTDALLDVVASEERVCTYFDIPFQHVSQRILRRMRRGGSRGTLERLVDRIRRRVPQATIRTSFIVGYPGEREEDFQQLLDHVRQVEYDHVGVFVYSDEEGTPAFARRDKVPARVARARQQRLMKAQARISLKKNKQRVGQRVNVLLEGYAEESHLLLRGRMASQAPEIDGQVLINDVPEGRTLRVGEFVDVEITEGFAYDLVGRII